MRFLLLFSFFKFQFPSNGKVVPNKDTGIADIGGSFVSIPFKRESSSELSEKNRSMVEAIIGFNSLQTGK